MTTVSKETFDVFLYGLSSNIKNHVAHNIQGATICMQRVAGNNVAPSILIITGANEKVERTTMRTIAETISSML